MDVQPRAPDLAAIEERQRKAWPSGIYSKQGAHFAITAQLLCEAVDLLPGRRVLDVATGNGNTALAAARRSCDVTGVDHVPAPLEDGRKRAAAEGFRIDFRVGDVENLPRRVLRFRRIRHRRGVRPRPGEGCERAAPRLLSAYWFGRYTSWAPSRLLANLRPHCPRTASGGGGGYPGRRQAPASCARSVVASPPEPALGGGRSRPVRPRRSGRAIPSPRPA